MNTKEKNSEIISKLKTAGFRVNIQYFRRNKLDNSYLPYSYYRLTNTQWNINPKGGLVLLSVSGKKGIKFNSLSKCHENDVFNRTLGLGIALSRVPVDKLITGS
jgi:hypothetical protein